MPKPTLSLRIMQLFFILFLSGLWTWADNVNGVSGTLDLMWTAFINGQLTW
ncbi:hypothetical protein [Salinivibrio sp. SS2]|uniref:hypothetical protein n=1 Tax=Salinivibrio sp. SS2 TaxID=1892894 RepID=UPI001586C15D|nr:hypothetical protein [Salinivibrio sp. DV]